MKTIKNIMAISTLSLAVAANAEITTNSSVNVLGVLPGEDPSAAILLGQGYDTVIQEGMGHCVKLGELKTQSGNTEGRVAEFQIEEIRSETDLRERLGISATAALMAALYGNPAGRVGFVYEARVNTQNRYLLIKSRVANQLEIADRFTFSDDVQELLERTGSDENAFVNACGNEFAYSRRTGVEFYALIEFLTITHEQARRFDAAAEGSYEGWRGVVDIEAMLARFNGISETRIRMIQMGGIRSFPEIADIEEFARSYPTLIDASMGGTVALELITKNYGGVMPSFLAPDLRQTRIRSATVDEIARNREKVNDMLRAIDHIQNNLPFYQYNRKIHNFSQWRRDIREFSDHNDSIARSCLMSNWDWCHIPPQHKMPYIELPVRKFR